MSRTGNSGSPSDDPFGDNALLSFLNRQDLSSLHESTEKQSDVVLRSLLGFMKPRPVQNRSIPVDVVVEASAAIAEEAHAVAEPPVAAIEAANQNASAVEELVERKELATEGANELAGNSGEINDKTALATKDSAVVAEKSHGATDLTCVIAEKVVVPVAVADARSGAGDAISGTTDAFADRIVDIFNSALRAQEPSPRRSSFSFLLVWAIGLGMGALFWAPGQPAATPRETGVSRSLIQPIAGTIIPADKLKIPLPARASQAPAAASRSELVELLQRYEKASGGAPSAAQQSDYLINTFQDSAELSKEEKEAISSLVKALQKSTADATPTKP